MVKVRGQSDYLNYVGETEAWTRKNIHFSAEVKNVTVMIGYIKFNDARYETLFRLKYSEYIR